MSRGARAAVAGARYASRRRSAVGGWSADRRRAVPLLSLAAGPSAPARRAAARATRARLRPPSRHARVGHRRDAGDWVGRLEAPTVGLTATILEGSTRRHARAERPDTSRTRPFPARRECRHRRTSRYDLPAGPQARRRRPITLITAAGRFDTGSRACSSSRRTRCRCSIRRDTHR